MQRTLLGLIIAYSLLSACTETVPDIECICSSSDTIIVTNNDTVIIESQKTKYDVLTNTRWIGEDTLNDMIFTFIFRSNNKSEFWAIAVEEDIGVMINLFEYYLLDDTYLSLNHLNGDGVMQPSIFAKLKKDKITIYEYSSYEYSSNYVELFDWNDSISFIKSIE